MTNVVPEFGPWCRSSYSSGGDNCVDVALSTDGTQVRARDSKTPADPPCMFTAAGWEPVLAAVAASRPAGVRPDAAASAVSGHKVALREALDLAAATWRPAGPEAEFAFVGQAGGTTAVMLRQATALLVFTIAEWDAFVAGVRDGEFTLARLAQQREDTPLYALVRPEATATRAPVEVGELVPDRH